MPHAILQLYAQTIAREPVGSDWIWVLLWVVGVPLIAIGSWIVTLRSKGSGPWRQR